MNGIEIVVAISINIDILLDIELKAHPEHRGVLVFKGT